MYCESIAALSFTDTESYINAHQTIMDFWGRVTPGILQLLSHSKVVCSFDLNSFTEIERTADAD